MSLAYVYNLYLWPYLWPFTISKTPVFSIRVKWHLCTLTLHPMSSLPIYKQCRIEFAPNRWQLPLTLFSNFLLCYFCYFFLWLSSSTFCFVIFPSAHFQRTAFVWKCDWVSESIMCNSHCMVLEIEKRADGAGASVLFFLLSCANFWLCTRKLGKTLC